MSFARKWMELEVIMLSETSQSQKDKHLMFSLLCGIQEATKQNKTKQKQNRTEPRV
jgi:hypothetical protein